MSIPLDDAELVTRSITNLEFVEKAARVPQNNVFEVTQLVNSFLLVLLRSRRLLKGEFIGKPITADFAILKTKSVGGKAQVPTDLQQLLNRIRNAFGHGCFDLLPDEQKPSVIGRIELWNTLHEGDTEHTWDAESLRPADLRKLLISVAELVTPRLR
jgi:hypothetical protein